MCTWRAPGRIVRRTDDRRRDNRRRDAAMSGAGDPVMSPLERWVEVVCFEFGLAPGSVNDRLILDMARDVAHAVDRPAAPLTAYLLGLAVARGHPLEDSAARVSELAAGWEDPPPG
jgi:hypothetical protein